MKYQEETDPMLSSRSHVLLKDDLFSYVLKVQGQVGSSRFIDNTPHTQESGGFLHYTLAVKIQPPCLSPEN